MEIEPKTKNEGEICLPGRDEIISALADIALGRRAFPEADKNGEVSLRLPGIAERMKGLEQLCRCLRLCEEAGGEILVTVTGEARAMGD